MALPKVPWRKISRLGKGVVICTRLISLVAIGAGKKRELKMGSVRTICLSKCPDRTGKGRGVIGLASNSNHAPPVQAFQIFNSYKTIEFDYAKQAENGFNTAFMYCVHWRGEEKPTFYSPSRSGIQTGMIKNIEKHTYAIISIMQEATPSLILFQFFFSTKTFV